MAWLCPIIWEMLKRVDYELAIKVKTNGCLHCKGKLDWASFPRKPRGIESLYSERRLSLTPRSTRFLWKKFMFCWRWPSNPKLA